jgi:hypothetical protein
VIVKAAEMPVLEKVLFTGQEEAEVEDLTKAEVTNFGVDVKTALAKFGWKGEAAGCVGLGLSVDNRRVETGRFVTIGRLEGDDIKFEAKKLWQRAESQVTVTMRFKQADIFIFSDGTLCSDFVPEGKVTHCFHKVSEGRAPTPVMEAEKEKLGIGKFTVRMICGLAKKSSVKNGVVINYVIVAYPGTKDEILQLSEHAQTAAWPGVKITEGEFPLLPQATVNWQCPIVPLLLPGTPFDRHPYTPAAGVLRCAISAVMKRTSQPEFGKSAGGLAKLWEKYAASPNELQQKHGYFTWPETGKEPSAQG